MRAKRRRHATDHRITLGNTFHVRGRIETLDLSQLADEFCAEMLEIIFAALERFDLGRINVESEDLISRLMERAEQRKADIAQADHAVCRGAVLYFLFKCNH